MIFESIPQYLETVNSLVQRLEKIDLILNQMENSMLASQGNSQTGEQARPGVDLVEEYSLDDGQTKIRTKYRDVSAFIGSYGQLMKLRNMIQARLNNNISGRILKLMDSSNFV